MFCPKCGSTNQDGTSICQNCNQPFHANPENLENTYPVTPPPNTNPIEQFQRPIEDPHPVHHHAPQPNGYTNYPPNNFQPQQNYGAPQFVARPKPADTQPHYHKITDNFVFSILVALLFTASMGIPAIILSVLSSSSKAAGEMAKAEEYSSKARILCIIGVILGLAKWLFIIFLFGAIIIGAIEESTPYYREYNPYFDF